METEIINGQKINIINNILSHMKKKGISKSELAKQIGWSVSKTSKIFSTEPDSQKINISDLIAIGIALECNPMLFMLGNDEFYTRAHSNSIHDIFCSFNSPNEHDCIHKITSDLPDIISFYLDLKNTSMKVFLKVRSKDSSSFEENTYPRVIVQENGVGSLYGQDISVGYWFKEDLSGVYLAINYSDTDTCIKNEQDSLSTLKERVSTFKRFISETENDLSIELCAKSNARFEAGMIKTQYYDFENIPSEDILRNDLRLFYEIYKKLLNICVLRVKRNYLAHGTPLKTENIQLIQQQLIDASSLDKYLDIKPGPQRSYYNALAREKYKCEVNPDHMTFLNVKNNQPYMEAMPLIPLSSQCDYKVSLRAQENICCLCPECKAKLTYADNTTREDMIVRLYDKHKQKLKSIGISITLKQLLDYYHIK